MGAYHAVEADYDIQYLRHGAERAVGSGSYGEVRPCTHTATHKLRAVKTIEKTSWSTRGHVLNEIAILRAVAGKHPNIIEFVEFFEEWGVMNLIFEFCPKGNLEEAFKSRSAPSSESSAAPLLWQVLKALAFLRAQDIVHRDVKPANLLFADETTLKLADFGTAVVFEGEALRVPEGTPAFYAPEVLQLPRGKGYSFPVDAWAAGVTFYMMLFKGVHPFDADGVVHKPRLCSGEFDVGWLTSSTASDLLEWLLMPSPEQRISVAEALQHPWLAYHRYGEGGFSKEKPGKRLVLDSHKNWLAMRA